MGCGRRIDNEITHSLVICIKREVGLEKFLGTEIEPVKMW